MASFQTQEPLAAAKARIRSDLQRNGTDVDLNDRTPLGDGDQSPIKGKENNDRRQFYRGLFSEGGDIFDHLTAQPQAAISNFAMACVTGLASVVKEKLEEADDGSSGTEYPSDKLIHLLECRETSMRLSPLLMMVSITKNFPDQGKMEQAYLDIVKLLLHYGARPQAKDVVGKTICHYGMGAMATEMTVRVGSMCIDAHQSSYFFGKEVELHGLKTAHMNGKRGVARGYVVGTGRRAVHIFGEKGPIGIKPENIKLAGKQNSPPRHRALLCNIQDRLGSLCLHEVLMQDRVDVAKVLLNKYNARVDIEDYEGVSPKSMAMTSGSGLVSRVAVMVGKVAMKQGRKATKIVSEKCIGCGKLTEEILECSVCRSKYCSKSCQKQHWKVHKTTCKAIAADDEPVVLESPPVYGHSMTYNSATGKASPSDLFRKPAYAEIGQPFYVKVQCGTTPVTPLMIYDKHRECNFTYSQDRPGFDRLFTKTRAQAASNGRKSYFEASFDKTGKMSVYLHTSTLKTW